MAESNQQPKRIGSADVGTDGKKKGGPRFSRKAYRNNGPRQPKFEGACDDLKGHIFDCSGYEQSDVFVKTLEQITIYVGRTYSNGGVLSNAIEAMSQPTVKMPDPPTNYGDPSKVDHAEKFVWEQKIKEALRTQDILAKNIQQIYSIAIGQSSDAMMARLEAHPEFEKVNESRNGIDLLQMIKSICFNFQDQMYVVQSIYEAKQRFYTLQQGKYETVSQYYDKFQNNLQVLEQCGGTIGDDEGVRSLVFEKLKFDPATTVPGELKLVKDTTREYYLSIGFILRADRSRFGTMIRDFENAYTTGRNEWPKSLVDAHRTLMNWKRDQNASGTQVSTDGLSFIVDGEDRRRKIRCWGCGKFGHIENNCPETEKKQDETTNVQVKSEEKDHEVTDAVAGEQLLINAIDNGEFDATDSFQFITVGADDMVTYETQLFTTESRFVTLNTSDGAIPDTWVLLDNQSTVDVFSNPKLLVNLREEKSCLRIHTQAGKVTTHWKGDLPGYGTVWYCKDGIANILSLAKVKENHKVTFDSEGGNEFVVHKPGGKSRRFKESSRGLYYMDT